MKAHVLCLLLACTCEPVFAEDFWFALDPDFPISESNTHYASADAACRQAYAMDVKADSSPISKLLSYRKPTAGLKATPIYYNCSAMISFSVLGFFTPTAHIIYLQGDTCPDGLILDVAAGACESLSDFQARRQLGDPNGQPNNDPNDCSGNPINGALGNKFQSEADYADADGELRFAHFYNGADGLWRHSYGTSLLVGPDSIALNFEDGRVSLFTLSNGVATAEPTELGSLNDVNGSWIYTSPTNEQMTFDILGRLVSLRAASGQTTTISYDTAITVTDSRGHTLTYTEDTAHQPTQLTASGVTVTYNYPNGELTSVSRALAGKTTTRSYVYEDSRNSTWLTGIIDERGTRFATWSYDDQGRAISSEHAGGAEKVTLAYNADGSTTVTNALGNAVTYQYAIVQGTKRMAAVHGSPAVGCPASDSSYTYEGRGQIATHTDALGHVTAFTYDTQGRVITQVEAQGSDQERTTTTTYNGTTFLPATITTADRVTSYSYDAQGRLLSTTVHPTH